MDTVRKVVGSIWLIVPLLFLAWHIWRSTQSDFVSLGYYAISWGSLAALALCGFWYLVAGPGAKWVLRVAGVLLALYLAALLVIAASNAPTYGGHDYLLYAAMSAGLAFCVLTYLVAGRHAT
jgi:hypothetical protein